MMMMMMGSNSIFTGSALVSTSASTSTSTTTSMFNSTKPPQTPSRAATVVTCISTNKYKYNDNDKNKIVVFTTAIATAAAAVVLCSSALAGDAGSPTTTYNIYYGTAASAANYGGYGGNSSKKDSAEYTYDVPQGWKERLVSKVEKGTNGTDSEFYNPKKKTEREYLTFLSGYRKLDPIPKDVVLNNLALSDVVLLDQISNAESLTSQDRRDPNGQLYYDYEIHAPASHSLISVTCANNKLYAHFVNAPAPEWNRDQDMLRHLHLSFKTLLSF